MNDNFGMAGNYLRPDLHQKKLIIGLQTTALRLAEKSFRNLADVMDSAFDWKRCRLSFQININWTIVSFYMNNVAREKKTNDFLLKYYFYTIVI